MCGHGEGGGDTGKKKKQKKVLHRGNMMLHQTKTCNTHMIVLLTSQFTYLEISVVGLANHLTVYILYNYCIHDLRDQGVHIYIYIYGINHIIQSTVGALLPSDPLRLVNICIDALFCCCFPSWVTRFVFFILSIFNINYISIIACPLIWTHSVISLRSPSLHPQQSWATVTPMPSKGQNDKSRRSGSYVYLKLSESILYTNYICIRSNSV